MTAELDMAAQVPTHEGGTIEGDILVPAGAQGLVVFAHGSGSSRWSVRNRVVAHHLQAGGLGTFLADLLTAEEERVDQVTAELRFDIDLLASRVQRLTRWAAEQPALAGLPIGLFGASTGAAAALLCAARDADLVRAVVSRGGRPDLAGDELGAVRSPTLLIVGSRDPQVLQLNERAARRLTCEWRLEIVDGATHLFEEPGAIDRVSELAAGWFSSALR